MITKIIDYRNLKYQGQTINGRPHGVGIIYDYKNLFALAEWTHGEINGSCLIVFGDSKIFYGSIKNRLPDGICTYHLKDKCQVFCNFHPLQSSNSNSKSPQQQDVKKNILVALLPAFNMIIKVMGQREEQLIISDEQVYKKNDLASMSRILQKMLSYRFMQNQLDAYLTLEGFVRKMFMQQRQYQGLLDTVSLTNPDGAKELFLTFKTTFNQPSLGIKIQNCMNDPNAMTNLHNDGHSYIVKQVGMFSKEGLLEYGLKNVKTLIKGSVKQQSINNDEKSVIRYENESSRPKKCAMQMLNHLKSSPNFINRYMSTKHLYSLQSECLSINFNIKQTQTKKFAQLILENPKQLTNEEKENIQKVRGRKNKDGSVLKDVVVSQTPQKKSEYNKLSQKYQKESGQLELAKQDIYRSVSKKRHNQKSSSPYARALLHHNSPQKQIKPAELTTVKPILSLYKNTSANDEPFDNSVMNNNPKGYQYPIGRDMREIDDVEMRTPETKYHGVSADYIRSLENRRRLYEQSDLNRVPVEENYGLGNNNNLNRKKYHYLPESQFQLSSHPVTHNVKLSSNQKQLPYPRYDYDNNLSTHTLSSYNIDSYPPSEDYLILKRKNDRSLSKQGRDDSQVGKLRRVRPMQTQNTGNSTRSQKYIQPLYKPIIVPQFKISSTRIGTGDYLQNPSLSPGQDNRSQFLKVPFIQQRSSRRRSPLLNSTQGYRVGDQSIGYNGVDESYPRYRNESQQVRDRSRSPQGKTRRIISTDNHFGGL